MTKADREERRSKKLERDLKAAKLEADQLRIEANALRLRVAKLEHSLRFVVATRATIEERLKNLSEPGAELKAESAA